MDLLWLNALPLLAAFLLALSWVQKQVPALIRTGFSVGVMAFIFVALLGYHPYVAEAASQKSAIVQSLTWVPQLGLSLSIYLDGLALIFGLVISGVGTAVFLYAGFYFDDPEEGARFVAWLMAFAGAMLGVVLAGNLITLFILWEGTSITSFMLIGFKGAKYADARWGALQAFLITGGGALALIVGLVMLGAVAGEVLGVGAPVLDMATLLSADPAAIAQHPWFGAILLLVCLGAFTKSAQFPFHFWLPNAMSAPTPASAYLHSATMVKAGIYLLARLYPPMHQAPAWSEVLIFFGLLTMFIGAFFALSQRDLKGLLAYSTISQLGALVALIGLPEYGGFKALMVGILAHALYKAALFLAVGTVDHSTGTRIIDKLGGLAKLMPRTALVVLVSALSMAGLFPLFGFVAKEVLLDGFVHQGGMNFALLIITLSALFTVIGALIVLWDVFFAPAREAVHFHASSVWLDIAPALLALGTLAFGFLATPLIQPLIAPAVPKSFSLYLLPADFLTLVAFWLSSGALVVGGVLFVWRKRWIDYAHLPLPKGTHLFAGMVRGMDSLGTFALRLQNGQVRYYLTVIFGTLSLVILAVGVLPSLANQSLSLPSLSLSSSQLLQTAILIMAVIAGIMAVVFRNHMTAVLALGVLGYSVGGIFLLEYAPDVAMVQFLVETLTTILVIVLIGRISGHLRTSAMQKLWQGRSRFDNTGLGVIRDGVIASVVGVTIFLFALTALTNRPPQIQATADLCQQDLLVLRESTQTRTSIASYHLCNSYADFSATDVVAAIVTDYRGMDTYLEIIVVAVAGLGVLTLLSRGLQMKDELAVPSEVVKMQAELEPEALGRVQNPTQLHTPFTAFIARLILPVCFMIAAVHINYGGVQPGDGFTAGVLLGLASALWFVVFGYDEAKARLGIFAPHILLRAGLLLALVNGLVPAFVQAQGQLGQFMGYLDYGALLGLGDLLNQFSLKFSTTLVFELAICLTVFGGVNAIMETIAYPVQSPKLEEAR